ncbi:MAG: signal peptide peptidase SppA [bacterium]
MRNLWFWIIIGILGVMVVLGFVILNIITERPGLVSISGNYIGVVKIDGPIYDSEKIVRQIKLYRENKSVRGIVIRIDSPGGGVSPTQEIVYEIEKTRKERKIPIYCSMGNVCASGGYYIASACDKIYANAGTLTGSIGVIISLTDISQLITKLGIKMNVIKSGKFKDTGSMFREMVDEERLLLEGLVNDIYDQFVEAVVSARKMVLKSKINDKSDKGVHDYVLKFADGRVFSGRQAKDYGFIDELGTLDECIDACAKEAGIRGKPRVIVPKKPKGLLATLLGEETITDIKEKLNQTPSVEYMLRFF